MRRMIAIALLFIFGMVLPAVKVLVIYASDYESGMIVDLPLARVDAERFAEFFESIPGAKIDIVGNPTYAVLLKEFKRFIRGLGREDIAVVYYAGHGMSYNGDFYLIPVDADPDDRETWISFGRLKRYVQSWMRIVWFIDACYSGSVVKGRPLKVLRIDSEGLEEIAGSVVFTSASENEISRESEGGGVFTTALIEGLRGKADFDGDGWIEARELYEYVRKRVEEMSDGRQHPTLIGPRDFKVAPNVSLRIRELIETAEDLHLRGEIDEDTLENLKALLRGEDCSGPSAENLREVVADYISGAVDEEVVEEAMVELGGRLNCARRVREPIYIPHGTAKLVIVPKDEILVGARVYIDGRFAGILEKGGMKLQVPEGIHRVDVLSKIAEDITFEFEVGKYGEHVEELKGRRAEREVLISSEPEGAEVFLNGKRVGKTPLEIRLTVGEPYELVLKRDGFEKLEKTILVREKGSKMRLDFELEIIKASLTVESTPSGAEVFLNGERLGVTPLTLRREEFEGILKVKFGNRTFEKKVDLKGGESKRLFFDFTKAAVVVKSDPEGAEVLLDGRRVGVTPLKLSFRIGEVHELILKKEGFLAKVIDLKVTEDFEEIFEKLEKVPGLRIVWKGIYGGEGWDRTRRVLKSGDAILIAGYSSSRRGDVGRNNGFEDVWILEIDDEGKIRRSHTFGGPYGDLVTDMESCDDGYVLVGERRVGSSSWPFVMRLDGSLGVVWEKEIRGKGNAGALGVACMNGKIAVVGYTKSFDGPLQMKGGWKDAFIVVMDDSGNILRTEVIGGGGEESLNDVVKADGKFLAVGYSSSSRGEFSGNKGWRDGWVLFFGESGEIFTSFLVGGGGGDVLEAVDSIDGAYIAAGYTDSLELETRGMNDFFVVLFDEGGVRWKKAIGGRGDDEAYGVKTFEKGVLVVGKSESRDWVNVERRFDAVAVFLDRTGEALWKISEGGRGDDEFRDAIEVDGNIVIVGTEFSYFGEKRWGNYLAVEVGM